MYVQASHFIVKYNKTTSLELVSMDGGEGLLCVGQTQGSSKMRDEVTGLHQQ